MLTVVLVAIKLLLNAAFSLLAEKSYSDITIRELATRSSVHYQHTRYVKQQWQFFTFNSQ